MAGSPCRLGRLWGMKVSIQKLKPLPVVVTVPVASQTEAAASVIRAGEAPSRPVVVAACNGMMYPIDGLDTLEAYRAAGHEKIECVMVEAGTAAEAVGMHLGLSRRLPTNPFCVMDAISWMMREGMSLAGVDRRYIRLMELELAGDIRGIFDSWLKRLAGRLETVPAFWHILEPLSKIEASQQGRALKSVMAFVKATGTTPDASSLREILRQFASAEQGRTDHLVGIDSQRASECEETAANVGTAPVKRAGHVRCECGQEWYMDVKRGDIRRIQESDSIVVLADGEGEPVYPVPPDVARHMDMGNAPVYHYVVPGEFPLVLVSARRLDRNLERAFQALRAALE